MPKHGTKLCVSIHALRLGSSNSCTQVNRGDANSMLGLIAHLWKIKITLINYLTYDAVFVVYGPYEAVSNADIYIIYNGWSHYTATGTAAFALHAHT